MTRRQLLSAADAVPATKQHEQPCSDCPWSREALHGWLGSLSPEEWVQVAHGETLVDCHCYTGAQCAGLAIYRANVCKTPRDPRILRLPKDHEVVFSHTREFLEHHEE